MSLARPWYMQIRLKYEGRIQLLVAKDAEGPFRDHQLVALEHGLPADHFYEAYVGAIGGGDVSVTV